MKVLIVEDDLALADVLAFTLRRNGFETLVAHDGLEGYERWQVEAPDLIILDLNLPQLDGLAVCRRIRASSETPIIILSVRSDDDDVVQGLEMGADEYVVKPFSLRQLIARIEAVLRRTSNWAFTPGPVQAGECVLDPVSHRLWISGRLVTSLTPLEARLLEILIRNYRQVVPTDSLIDYVWGPSGGDRIMLKQLVYRLRRKISAESAIPDCIETFAGVGYSFAPDASLVEQEELFCLV